MRGVAGWWQNKPKTKKRLSRVLHLCSRNKWNLTAFQIMISAQVYDHAILNVHHFKITFMCPRSIAGVPSGPALRATLLLRTIRMRSQRLRGISRVMALKTNKQINRGCKDRKKVPAPLAQSRSRGKPRTVTISQY